MESAEGTFAKFVKGVLIHFEGKRWDLLMIKDVSVINFEVLKEIKLVREGR